MRLKSLLLALAALIGLGSAPIDRAAADGMKRHDRQEVQRRAQAPRPPLRVQAHPYAYNFSPRGYYPDYNSAYWAPARHVRERNHMHYYHWVGARPPYFQSWGHPVKHWDQRAWHDKHHGRIRRHHW